MRLTAKQAEHVKPDTQKRVEVPAGPPAGLYLVVQPTGAKIWALRYRWLGRTAKLTFKPYPDMSLAAARAEAEAALEKLRQGINPSADYAREQQEPNAAETVLDEWLSREVKPGQDGEIRVRTWREIERVVNKEIRPLCRHKLVSQIGRPDILRLVDSIVDRGAPIAANETLSIIKRWLNWCIERGYLESSPAAPIGPPAAKRNRDRVLTEAELAEVWGAAEKMLYPYGAFLRLLVLSAQRRGEVAEMRWENVDLDGCLWTLPADQTKAGRIHDVPLSPPAVEILRSLPRFAGPFVFTTNSGSKPINSFSKCKARLDAEIRGQRAKGEKLGEYTMHDFRRSAATWMAKSGVPPHVLAALLNHSPGSAQGVTAIYNRFRYLDERRAALDKWGEYIESISKQKQRWRVRAS